MGTTESREDRDGQARTILREAARLCQQHGHGIRAVEVSVLPEGVGGGFAVNLSVPKNLPLSAPEIKSLVLMLEAIPGVTRVWVPIAD